MPAATPPTPNETIIRPSCDMVEYARMRLMSDCGTRAQHGETSAFEATVAAIVKKKCAAAIVQPEHAEKKSHVADARSDERLLCGSRRARSLDPEPDQQIRRKPHQFPENKKQNQAIRDNEAEHRAREKGEISKEPNEVHVLSHVA